MVGRRVAALALGLVVAGALAACGGTLETGQLESQVKEAIVGDIGVSVASVDCPDDIEAKAGASFVCTATGTDGSTASMEVVQTDDDGNVKISAKLVNIPAVEKELAGQIGEGGKVDCPDTLIAVKKGVSFVCDATAADATGRIRVTFENDEGRFSAEVVSTEGGS